VIDGVTGIGLLDGVTVGVTLLVGVIDGVTAGVDDTLGVGVGVLVGDGVGLDGAGYNAIGASKSPKYSFSHFCGVTLKLIYLLSLICVFCVFSLSFQ